MNNHKNKKRPIVSLFIGFCFTVILVTSIMMYLLRHSNTIASIHTTIGFLFLLIVVVHITYNRKAIIKYAINKDRFPISKTQIIVVAVVSITTLGIYSGYAPFCYVYDFGDSFRAQQTGNQDSLSLHYDIISTNTKIIGRDVSVEVTKGRENYYTVMAIWVEDSVGDYVETLYATKNIATGTFWQEIDGKAVRVPVRRPEAVPYWSYKRNINEPDGFKVPTPETSLPDAISGATPLNHYVLHTTVSDVDLGQFRILYEVNRSFDWNKYYSEDAFPDNPVYSGNGYVGQPSLIYSTPLIDVSSSRKSYLMEVVGHGHHSGDDGKLYQDLSEITTALQITERVLVIVN